MTPITRLNGKQIKIHILWWILVFGYFNIFSPIPGSWSAKIIGGAIDDANYIFVFYSLALYTFPIYWKNRQYLMIAIHIIIGYCVFTVINYFDYLKLVPILGGYTFYQNFPISMLLKENILYYSIFGSAGIAWFLYRYSAYNYKLQTEKEKVLLEKELYYIKNQFNSHITFNFLNYCFSKIHRLQPETAESIDVFSEMLRYNLQTKPDIKVPVQQEITHIENYIKLNKTLHKDSTVSFNFTGRAKNKFIAPHILIYFVEDALKKGMYNNKKNPIEITLSIKNTLLYFKIISEFNAEKTIIPDNNLENMQHFLNYYYPNNHSFNTKIINNCMHLELILKEIN
jgi:hypothetical protein